MKVKNSLDKLTIREILLNAFFIFAAVTVVGMISNVVILLVGWLTSMPVTASLDAQGYSEAEQQAVWLVLAVIAMLTCILCSFAITRAVGAVAAQYRIGYGRDRKLGIPTMLVTVGLGVGAHGICCAALASLSMAYLVIASPVQYIARFLGKGKNELFISDAFDFPKEYITAAIVIYVVLLGLTCGAAYMYGFTKRVRDTEKKERDDAASARWEARKAEREAGTVSNTPMESNWKKEIKRETLASGTEKRFRELNRQKILRTALFIVLWMAADVLVWYLWSKMSGREMFSPSAIFFTMLLVVPFWPMKKYEVFLGKTYYAEVVDIREKEEALPATFRTRTNVGGYTKTVREVYLRPKNRPSEKFVFGEKDMLNLNIGDHVLKLSAFKYPVNCNFDEAHDVYCPNCGHSNPTGRKHCGGCGFPLARDK